jgi:hypothetical protein
MSQTKTRASRFGGRLFKSAATSALALSAVAGGVMLTGGEAKAVACNGTPLNFTDTALGINFEDRCTLDPAGSTLFSVTPTYIRITGDPMWSDMQTTVDFDNLSGLGTSDIKYQMSQVSPAEPGFNRVQLRWEPPAVGTMTISKSIYSDSGYQNLITPISGNNPITTDGGILDFAPISTIYVKDVVTLTASPSNPTVPLFVPGINNDFRNVPGPLPILGAGAAFGFSRKLRSRIKAARTA